MPDICPTTGCGTGGWSGPLPGDPDNNSILTATAAYGGVDVKWSYPTLNPHAVSHVMLYRGLSSNFSASSLRVTVSGDYYYDRIPKAEIQKYYYWIQIVSVNGTVGDVIGPASATPMGSILEVMQDLTGLIDESLLSQYLKGKINDISNIAGKIADETANRLLEIESLNAALSAVQSDTGEALTYIQAETLERTTADEALITSYNVMAAGMAGNTAAIVDESIIRADEDGALSSRVTALVAKTATATATSLNEVVTVANEATIFSTALNSLVAKDASNASALRNIETTKIGYSALVSNGAPFDGNNSFDVYPVSDFPANTYPEYVSTRKRIVDKVGVDRWNAANPSTPVQWLTGLPLASAVKQIGVTGPDGQSSNIEQYFVTQKGMNDKYTAMYGTQLVVNGLRGGYGIQNDGTKVLAGFDVDTFYMGRSNTSSKTYPFIMKDDKVYITEAAIDSVTIGKLRTESGGVLIEGSIIRSGADNSNRSISQGYWSSGTSYIKGDNVIYDGNTWECILATSSALPSNTTYWKPLAIRGQGQVLGTAFIRSASQPGMPTGGTFNSPTPTYPLGWSDGIPADNNQSLWQSTRLFTSDGLAPHQTSWSTPAKVGTPSQGTRSVFSIDGSNWHTTPATSDIYMATQTSTDNGATWGAATGSVKIKGEKGDPGISLNSVTNYYLTTAASSGVSTNTYGWGTTVTPISEGSPYLWNYEKITKSDGTTINSTPAIIGTFSKNGLNGKGISSIQEYYQVTSSNTTVPSVWIAPAGQIGMPVTTTTNRYLWNKELITYTDGTSQWTAARVIGTHGATGSSGLIDPSVRTVLTGSGGIVAGNLAWNSSGVPVYGTYGVAMTSFGIVGMNSSGVGTFTLNAQTGDAYFGGTLRANIVEANNIKNYEVSGTKLASAISGSVYLAASGQITINTGFGRRPLVQTEFTNEYGYLMGHLIVTTNADGTFTIKNRVQEFVSETGFSYIGVTVVYVYI